MQRPPKLESRVTLETLQRHTQVLLLSTTALLFGACGQADPALPDPSNPGNPTDPNPTMKMDPPAPKDAIGLTMGPISVDSGTERTVCMTGQFKLDKAVDITSIVTHQQNSHHAIFYKYNKGTNPTVDTAPQECQPLNIFGGGGLKAPLFIGESSDPMQNVLQLPPGVAYHLEPNDYYMIEMHIVNATPGQISPTVDVFLGPAADSAGQMQYADMFFYSNTRGLGKNFDGKGSGLPPMTTTSLAPDFSTVPTTFKVFGITTHQHHTGVGISVAKSTSASDPGTDLFTNTDWQHPALYRLPDESPMIFAKNEGLRWICTYNNTSSSYINFGESGINDEMCIVWGYYYPSAGLKVVFN
jgi:hypothetical protein